MPFESHLRAYRAVAEDLSFTFDRFDAVGAICERSPNGADDRSVQLWTYAFIVRYFAHRCAQTCFLTETDCDRLVDRALHRIDAGKRLLAQPGAYGGWVAVVCRNLFIDELRSAARERPQAVSPRRVRRDEGPEPDCIAETRLTLDAVRSTLRSLPGYLRNVARLRLLDQISYAELSRLTGKPVPTLRAYVARATAVLRDRLRSDPPDPPYPPKRR